MSRFGIDLQHNGRNSRVDLGFPGEYAMLAQYGIGMQLRLHELGHRTFLNGMGEYSDRAKRFNTHNCNLVVLCHVNQNPVPIRGTAAGNRSGKIFLDYRTSNLNVTRAKKAATFLSGQFPWGFDVILAKPDDWTRNALNVQAGYKAWTWCLEPFFGDQQIQRRWIEGLGFQNFGGVIADAIHYAYA